MVAIPFPLYLITMEKKILCIIRTSTEKQETESQKKELVEYCQKLGFAEEELDYIEVAGASARKLNKTYIQMLEDIKTRLLTSNTLKAVALWDLNRLGRVESKLLEMKEFFVANKIQVYCKSPEFVLFKEDGTLSDGGGIVFTVFAAIVKHDTDEMFAKMNRGRMRNKEQGIYYGGQIKFGYMLNDTKHFVINPEEAAVVRTIFELYATGKYSIYSLVEELKSRGITKNGQKVTYDMIQKALCDKSYYKHKYPIITKELFDKCNDLKLGNAVALHTKESRNINFAVGLLRCQCGQNFIASGDFYLCYSKRCNSRKKKITDCDAPTIRKDIMDELLWYVTQRLHQKFLMEQDSTNVEEHKEKLSIINTKISQSEKDLASAKARAEKLDDDYYIEGGMTEAQYKKRLSGIQSKMQEFEAARKNYLNEAETEERLIKQLELPRSERYLETILLSDLDEEEMEDRRKIKDLMFTHIEKASVRQFKEGKHKLYEITIESKSGLSFVFVYDSWLNSHRKGECNIFYDDKPLYFVSGNFRNYNSEVIKLVKAKIGLPELSSRELGEAAISYIERTKDEE